MAPETPSQVPNKLPTDPKDFDAAIAPMRVMVKPVLFGISRLSAVAGTEPLDKDEIASGEIAFAALAYQYGAMLDARVLVALWLGGVTVPRVVQYFENKRKAEQEAKQPALAPVSSAA